MHCITLAEIAAVVAQHAESIVYRKTSIPSVAMVQYWATSRNRFELWHQAMARYQKAEKAGDAVLLRRWWQEHQVLLEEVLVSEMLTRVIAAMGDALDLGSETEEVAPITRAIHLSHLEATNRVQNLMLRGRGSSVQNTVRLNRLRTGVERWTDALLGRIGVEPDQPIQYGYDCGRARTHAEEMRSYGYGPSRDTALWLMNAAMRDMLSRRMSANAALPDANCKVAESVMMMLQGDLFDDIGTLKSLRLHRILQDHHSSDTVPETTIAEPKSSPGDDVDAYFNDDMHRWHMK